MSETEWDSSYPPSLFGPPVPPVIVPTGAVAGTPGHWTPAGATAPNTLAEANALGLSLGPTWVDGEYVPLATAGTVYWNGAAFSLGVAPAAEVEESAPVDELAVKRAARRKASTDDS
jgi:hypothetical protein